MREPSQPKSDMFVGPSEMHGRTRTLDWQSTPLGPVELWPQSLASLVKTLLASRYPMVLTWGPQFIQLYNDAYAKLIGDKHPSALGQDIRITLAEGWETLGPMIRDVMSNGVANWNPALLLALQRSGYLEEAYFDVSHAPAEDDSGQIVGMLAVCTEVTQQVLSERRLRLLHDLAVNVGGARSVAAICHDIGACIAEHRQDVPFALLYLREGEQLILRETTGLDESNSVPQYVDLKSDEEGWPFTQALNGETVLIRNVQRHVRVNSGPWNQPVKTALALPLDGVGQALAQGVLIVGVNPNRALDKSYYSFYDLLAGQVSAAVRNAQLAEEERERIEALARLDRAKTEFFSNVSHEFRTPLTLMLGPLEELLAEDRERLHAADREQIQVAHRNALRLLKLVNTLLDFSRTEAERAQAEYLPVDLAALTTDLASLFRSAIEKAGLELIVDCPPLPQSVYVDSDMWEKIVLNLLSNAFKFTHQGRIIVRQHLVGEHVALSISDTGCGIPQAELGNVFKRFHRIVGTQGRSHEGTGIGLALVQELARLHGGSVMVESDEAQGSTFTVTIPINNEQRGDTHPRAGQRRTPVRAEAYVQEALHWLPQGNVDHLASPRIAHESVSPYVELQQDNQAQVEDGQDRPRILLADDNADMRDYVRRVLSVRYDVIAVTNGEAALQAVHEQMPDVVLSDVMMPKIDGFHLLTQLRSDPQTRTIPVILLSARAGEEARLAGLESGADDYLIKPFAASELMARVTTHLTLARMRQAATEERARRTAAEATVRARDEFLSLAAHELKTPLTSIRGYIDLFTRRLVRDGNLASRDEQTLHVITQQVDRLSTLVSVLLDLSRLEMGQFVLEQQHIDLIPLIQRVADTVQSGLKHHILETRLPDKPLIVLGDELRLEQVLHNLLNNAIKYSPQGGTVTFGAISQDGQIRIFVRDQGIGIPEAGRDQIFQRFYRADNVDQGYFSGLGIGLYVVKQIIVQHGGTVDVVSREGEGSTFTVYLPASSFHHSNPTDTTANEALVGTE